MRKSMLFISLICAALAMLPVLSSAGWKLSNAHTAFLEKCTEECTKRKAGDCGTIRQQLEKFIVALDTMEENNQAAFDDMSSAGNSLAGMCPEAMKSRGF